jgi:nitrate/nitrite-specific signal transduction histidine kinase
MSDSALALSRLQKKVKTLQPYNLLKIEECQDELDQICSRLDAMYFQLQHLNDDTQRKVRNNCQVLAGAIEEYTNNIARIIERKSWLLELWKRLTLLMNFFEVVSRILSFFGIPTRMLPPPKND